MVPISHYPGPFAGFLNLGADPADTPQEKAFKSTHILISSVTAVVVFAWSVIYWAIDLPIPAAIPLIYTVLTGLGLKLVARTRRIEVFRASQLSMWLFLPFLLQWSLGGFANASAVAIWALSAPLLASLVGAIRWRSTRSWVDGDHHRSG